MRLRSCTPRFGSPRRAKHIFTLLVVALLVMAGPASASSSAASAEPPPSTYHVERSCAPPYIGHAACSALTLLPPALSLDETGAPASSTVIFEHPHPGSLTPQDLHAAYSLPTETASSFLQTIAVIDAFNDPTAEADLEVYDTQFGLPACTTANGCFRKINQEGKSQPLPPTEGGWASEISIDIETAHAICQNCRVLLVEANSAEFSDLGAAVNTAVAAGATEINNSYESEGDEATIAVGLNARYYDHPGIVVTASAGDCGYLGEACELSGVSFPASSPDVIAVGGTSLAESDGTWASSVWPDTGGGCSSVFAAPLWQSEVTDWTATRCGSARLVADLAAVGNPGTGIAIYDSTPLVRGGPRWGWSTDGGTSVPAPVVAAEFALAGGSQGVEYPSRTLYLYVGDSDALYDIVSGSNGSCDGVISCQAAIGYDGPSGVGSPIGLTAFSTPGSPTNSLPPSISGSLQDGQVVTESHGEWTDDPTAYSYQWARCDSLGSHCSAIIGATAETYTLTPVDVGSTIRVQETASDVRGDGPSAISTPTGIVAPDVATLRSFSPSSGPTGSVVKITGTPFSGAEGVKFGRLPASFTIVSATQIQATVPNGAHAGNLSVITPIGMATSVGEFTPDLAITGYRPASGPAGTHVILSGVGFTRASEVSFDGIAATSVTYISSTRLRVVVPPQATSGPISLTNKRVPRGTVSSANDFAAT